MLQQVNSVKLTNAVLCNEERPVKLQDVQHEERHVAGYEICFPPEA